MKAIYIIVGILVIIGLIFYLKSYLNKLASPPAPSSPNERPAPEESHISVKQENFDENPYKGLRDMAFAATPSQLGLLLPQEQAAVYGVVMDWKMGDVVVTTVAYQTGDASLYLSSGGGVIGGGEHENVNKAAKLFVQKAQAFLRSATKTTATPLPGKEVVIFYLLTNIGIYVQQEEMKNFENGRSPWGELFEEGNKVIAELRITSEGAEQDTGEKNA